MEKTKLLRTAVTFISLVLGLLPITSRSAGATSQMMNLAQNKVLELHCSSTSVIPKWNISGGTVPGNYTQSDFLEEVLSIDIKIDFNADIQSGVISTLCINGSETNNGVILQCIIDQDVIIDVTVMVQGVLSPPIIVDSTTNSTAIMLRWDPPFTLDIPDVDPDIIRYTVYCKNLGTGMTEAMDVDEPEFTFTGMQGEVPDPCHEYEFRVSAWNVVGESENSTVFKTCFREVPRSVNIETMTSFELSLIQFTITIVDMSCHGRQPESVTVTVTVDGLVLLVHTYQIESELNFAMNLPTGNSCTASVTARNQFGTSQPTIVILDCQQNTIGTDDDTENTPQPEKKLIIPAVVGVCAAVGCVVILTIALVCFVKWIRDRDQDIADLEKPSEDNEYAEVHTKPKVPPHGQTTITATQATATPVRQASTSSDDSQTTLLTDSQDQEKREQHVQSHYADLQQMQQQPPPAPSQPAGVEYAQIQKQQTDGE